MPEIRLQIGPMNLEGDATSKEDTVLALCYNAYRVGKSFHQVPSLSEAVDLGTNTHVWSWYSTLHNRHLAVSDGRLWSIASNNAATEITGCSLTSDTVPTFTEDTTNIYIAANSNIHQWTPGGASVTVMGGQSPDNVTSLAFISGFLVAVGDDSGGSPVAGDVWYSDNAGYTTWEVYNNESSPDAVKSVFATYSEIYNLGTESTEPSYLSGDATSPFAANKSASQPFGVIARYSVAFDKQSIYFLTTVGDNRQITRLINGREPQIISFDVSSALDSITNVANAIGFIMGYKGQSFYVITFPSAAITIDDQVHTALTLAFNIRSQEWYLWGDWTPGTTSYGRWPVNSCIFIEAWNKRYAGGTDGKIYTLVDEDRATNPSMIHRWRDDAKLEWTDGRTIPLGEIGDRRSPLRTYVCGRYRQRQDEIIFYNGDIRTAIRTGWRNWGNDDLIKISNRYSYNVKRGDVGVVFNRITEDWTPANG